MRIRYIEPIGSDIHVPHTRALLEAHAPAGVAVEVVHLELPPALSGPMLPPVPLYLNEILQTVLAAEDDGVDAAVIGCCSDPGLQDVQRVARIPVIGPLQASASVAAARGRRLAILFPDEHAWQVTANWVRRNLRAYGLADVVGPIAFVPMHEEGEGSLVGDVSATADVVRHRFNRQLHGPAVDVAAATLASDPADAVLFGCTLWGGMVAEIADRVDAWCLDPVLTAFEMAIAQARVDASVRGRTRDGVNA